MIMFPYRNTEKFPGNNQTDTKCCIFARIHRFIKKTIIKIHKSTYPIIVRAEGAD